MKLVMFSFLDELSGDGARVISALLKAEGHDVKSFYLPFFGADGQDLEWVPEAQTVLEEADMYMMSVLSCYEQRAATVTRYLKKHWPKRPVVWGGVHATALPEGCLKYADFALDPLVGVNALAGVITPADITMALAAAGPEVITGIVFEPDGITPAANVEIIARNVSGEVVGRTTTNGAGIYALVGKIAGLAGPPWSFWPVPRAC